MWVWVYLWKCVRSRRFASCTQLLRFVSCSLLSLSLFLFLSHCVCACYKCIVVSRPRASLTRLAGCGEMRVFEQLGLPPPHPLFREYGHFTIIRNTGIFCTLLHLPCTLLFLASLYVRALLRYTMSLVFLQLAKLLKKHYRSYFANWFFKFIFIFIGTDTLIIFGNFDRRNY